MTEAEDDGGGRHEVALLCTKSGRSAEVFSWPCTKSIAAPESSAYRGGPRAINAPLEPVRQGFVDNLQTQAVADGLAPG